MGPCFLVWWRGDWIASHLRWPAATLFPRPLTAPNPCLPATVYHFCLHFFPPCVYQCTASWQKKQKNKKTHDHDECSPLTPLILRRRKGERLPQGQALLVWPNAVWHSQQLPLRLCMTASAVTSFFFFFFCCLLLFAPAFSEQKKNNKKGHVWFSRMVTHDK